MITSHETMSVVHCLWKKLWTQTPFQLHFVSKSSRLLLNSPKLIRGDAPIGKGRIWKLFKIVSTFYHSLHIRYYEPLTNIMWKWKSLKSKIKRLIQTRHTLPSAYTRQKDTGGLCRVPTLGKQTTLPSVWSQTLGKELMSQTAVGGNHLFAECLLQALGKLTTLPSVGVTHSAKSWRPKRPTTAVGGSGTCWARAYSLPSV